MAAAIPPKVSKTFDVLVSIAASVVIYGALMKITHAPTADVWLYVGLTTEAVIFLGYGILYLIYPAIDDHQVNLANAPEPSAPSPLNATVEKVGDITDAIAATNEYTKKSKDAAVALGAVGDAFSKAASSATSFTNASESAKVYHDQVQILTKNLSSLNTIYELELQESNNHLKALNQFYGKLAETSKAMLSTADDATKAKEQISILATNLNKLNQIYGNMIIAMQGK
jgi:gliding motility-associated protein GldL